MINERLAQAVYNNAIWCNTVCRAHGWPGEFRAEIWLNRHGSLPYYPNAVTLTATHDLAAQTQQIRDLSTAGLADDWAVKDSFCTLDLTPLGFQPLFSTWLYRSADLATPVELINGVQWREVQNASELITWEQAWRGAAGNESTSEALRMFPPVLLADDSVVFLAADQDEQIVAGAILNRTGTVVGLSNVFVPSVESAQWWSRCVIAASAQFLGLPLVGYERDEELVYARQSGFEEIGSLRVWIKAALGMA